VESQFDASKSLKQYHGNQK
jgi:hypothetical protein